MDRLKIRPKKPALFLDRDGVVNYDDGYVHKKEHFRWIPGAIETIKCAQEHGYYVFIVTNQSGVARGYYQMDDVVTLMHFVETILRDHHTKIDDWRCCPFHPKAKVAVYRGSHPWRKPSGGMLRDLMAHWPVIRSKSLLIGDQESDVQAARDADVAGFLFPGGNLYHFSRPLLL